MSEHLLIAKLNVLAARRLHEDDMIAQRMAWLTISQSFLFGTFAMLNGQLASGADSGITRLMLQVIPLIGVALSTTVAAAIGAAVYTMRQWRRYTIWFCSRPEVAALDWPLVENTNSTAAVIGQGAPLSIAIGLAICWVLFLSHVSDATSRSGDPHGHCNGQTCVHLRYFAQSP
jgi:hypothetical protein